jgi:hypothetical protein
MSSPQTQQNNGGGGGGGVGGRQTATICNGLVQVGACLCDRRQYSGSLS